MIINARIRFSYSDCWESHLVNIKEFVPNTEFKDQIFGWYKGEYISIIKTKELNNVIKQRD
jgi:hypothetical protein